MRCAIVQPHYLPWIGYFEMIDRVDVFVLFDDVDFIKREWKNRNRIRMERLGERTRWLTVPVLREDQRDTPIHRTRIDHTRSWAAEHIRNIQQTYRHTQFYASLHNGLSEVLQRGHPTLAELNADLIQHLCDVLGIETRIVRASELAVTGRKTDRLANICSALGADAYLANNGSATYLDGSVFTSRHISWRYQDYQHPVYPQWSVWRDGRTADLPWISHLSIIDALFNLGPEETRAVMRVGRPSDDA